MTPIFFQNQEEFRIWLEKHHTIETELFVGFYKVSSGKPSMSWSQSVDQALCFGWIDGVKYSIDHKSYQIRFTPRKKTSIWSAVNIKKVETLIETGLMKDAGLVSFNNRTESKSKIYSFENEEVRFSPEFEKLFKANAVAWDYFQSLAQTYRKPSSHWVMSAKQESTRIKRLNQLIADSELGTNKWKHNKYSKK
jgi:uncharacterized protein YdeI (YjbR/CyaY-like superfamily)